MYYSKWIEKNEMKQFLTKVNLEGKLEKSGLPILYDDNDIYLNTNNNNSLVIGTKDSKKDECVIIPTIKLGTLANENMVINDVNGSLYKKLGNNFEEKGYKNIVINLNDYKYGNSFNPLSLPYNLYLEDKKDKALELIENIGYYLFRDKENSSDPFWENSCIDYFTGIVLYLFENASVEEINLNSVYNVMINLNENSNSSKFLNNIDKNSVIYVNVVGTLNAPSETRGSIISIVNQKLKKYISRIDLSNMLAHSDFDITKINLEKTAIFIIGSSDISYINLISLLINQIYESIKIYGDKIKQTNFILDDFDLLFPIKNIDNIINNSNNINTKFILTINNFKNLTNNYGHEKAEILKLCCSNVIYLLSNDDQTLNDIRKMCGNHLVDNKVVPLISTDELARLNYYEAIILLPRIMPFRTVLKKDSDIFNNSNSKVAELIKRNPIEIKVYNLLKNLK